MVGNNNSVTNNNDTSALGRLLSRVATIEPRELSAVVAAFLLFFFMWAGYFAVRPVRETIATIIGRDQTADLWIITSLASILIIPLYGSIVAKFRRSAFLPSIYGVAAIVLAFTGFALRGDQIDPMVGKFFYVFISVVNLFLLSIFWSFLLELFDMDQSKRLFGVIAAGGSAGALAGPFISFLIVERMGNSGVLFVGAAFFVAAIVCQRALLKIWNSRASQGERGEERPLGGNIFAGVTLLLKSPYVLGIALFVVFISTVNTILYFEQLRLVEVNYPEITDRTRIFAGVDWIVQTLTVISQIFLTGRIAKRFGVIALVTAIPLIMVGGFLVLAATGTLVVLMVVVIGRRAMEYAFVRPGREMLWSPLDKETKYKAKSTVDVPVYRGADAIAAQVNKAVEAAGVGPAAIAMMGAGVALVWAAVGWWLGKRCEAMAPRDKLERPGA
ncbi:MAG TPA: MFS transporter [Steroidobacteraceae bacterium]|nr:MFS transporter [Steroidobacteraceae bacterium]